MPNLNLIKKYNRVHMIGIGGVSMSGIAEILNNFGVIVTGSDISNSEIINKLQKSGISVTIGHDFENLSKADIVVYSAAINENDPEMQKAKELNIETCERCDFLGLLTKAFSNTIGISGTHGKTTTTSLVSLCFLEAGLDPSIQVGALLKAIDGNYKVGSSEHFIIEACEYVESFLKFSPKSEIILNIDNDHLDYFKTFENIKNAFIKYVKLIPDDGLLVVNGDDSNCIDLLQYTNATKLTYGITNKNTDFFAVNIVFDNNGFPAFDVYKKDKFFERIQLRIPGMHNVLNALACIALCDYYGINSNYIKSALQKFTGAHRRFEYKGTVNNATVFDDYGHHPTEIIATAKALMNKKYNKSWVVFQPHTYSRTKTLLNDFAKALLNFDNIIITDIYAARETNRFGISSQDLVDKINSNATVFDDYGHHPTEIIATAKALMNKKYNKSWVVFQPHTYSRTKTLLNDFAKALLNFDNIIITDIYAARETNRFGISSQDLVDKINSLGKNAIYMKDFSDIINYLKSNIKKDDIILTLGAGTVTQISNQIVEGN